MAGIYTIQNKINQKRYIEGRKRSPEAREKSRIAMLGKKLSKEIIEKRQRTRKKFYQTEETRKKISESSKGKHTGEKNARYEKPGTFLGKSILLKRDKK